MKFPIINISTEKWKEEYIDSYVSFDKFIYTDKDLIFKELYKDKVFCDCNGEIFKAIKKAELAEKWRYWLKFIPNIWKKEIIFEHTNKSLTVDELRNHLITRIAELSSSELNLNEFSQKWKVALIKAKTHYELINPEI